MCKTNSSSGTKHLAEHKSHSELSEAQELIKSVSLLVYRSKLKPQVSHCHRSSAVALATID